MDRPVHRPPHRRAGFSLILSLTVMAMLLLLCISIAALMAIELRLARSEITHAKAQLNARMAARIALGEMQRLLGQDRRITANGAIRGTNRTNEDAFRMASGVHRPRYAGVWRGPMDSSGNPVVCPVTDYESDHSSAFIGWLASGREQSKPLTELSGKTGCDWVADGAAAVRESDEWLMLNGGTSAYAGAPALMQDDTRSLFARPEIFNAANGEELGRFAWVAMDENQKARVDLRDPEVAELSPLTTGVFRAGAVSGFFPGYEADRMGDWKSARNSAQAVPPIFGWEYLTCSPAESGWFPAEPREPLPNRALRHDFTTESVTLLTDSANGGIKRDLNLMAMLSDADFDQQSDLPALGGATGYVGFDSTDKDSGRNAWRRSNLTGKVQAPAGDLGKIWPLWTDVREWMRFPTVTHCGSARTIPMLDLADGVGPYTQLVSFTEQKTMMEGAVSGSTDRTAFGYWRQPVIAKYRVEVRFAAVATGTTYDIKPHVQAIVQLWNPYNVALKLPNLDSASPDLFFLRTVSFPMVAKISTSGTKSALFSFDFDNSSHRIGGSIPLYASGGAQYLAPGEIRTFSFKSASNLGTLDETTLKLEPGYAPSGGVVLQHWNVLSGVAASDAVTVEVLPNTQIDSDWNRANYTTFEAHRGSSTNNPPWYLGNYGTEEKGKPCLKMIGGAAPMVWNNVAALTGNVGQLAPAFVFEVRLKAEAPTGAADDATRAWMGELPFLHNPFNMRISDTAAWSACPYEFVGWGVGYEDTENSRALAVAENPRIPGALGALGYMGTGYSATTGSSHWVYHHAPLHPPIGWLDLRHARLGGGYRPLAIPCDPGSRGTPPPRDRLSGVGCVRDAFGNALASPWITPKSIAAEAPLPASVKNGEAITPHDMSWIMNAALADTWYASSLGDWDQGLAAKLFPEENRSASRQLEDFLANKRPLPNRRLAPSGRPTLKLIENGAATRDAFRLAALQFEVRGGFNINSTSVRAWRAFLAALHTDTPTPGTVSQSAKIDAAGKLTPATPAASAPVVVPVATVMQADPSTNPASDTDMRTNGGRALSDAELDRLAQNMVNEVKKRGPFLSLGEFLNRRLESGALGAKGAVQAAIDGAGLNDHRKTTGRAIKPTGALNTEFQQAADFSGVGLPGWLSQADLLAPLATALTPRGDTFTVRVAGEADGVRRHYELTIRRGYDYLDTEDPAETEPKTLKKPANKAFGRRLQVVAVKPLDEHTL